MQLPYVAVPLEDNPPGRPPTVPRPQRYHDAQALIDPADADRVLARHWTLHRARSGTYVKEVGHGGIFLHRFVLGLPKAHGPADLVDHKDGDGLNCRRSNLRVGTNPQNLANSGSRPGSSRFKGVTWDQARGKWLAQIMIERRNHYLGRHDAEEDAARAYNAAATQAWGEYAQINVI
jgi:hypothetical protein